MTLNGNILFLVISCCRQDYNGDYFIGKVWPGETVFPDFAYSMTVDYWHGQVSLGCVIIA